LVLQEKSQLTIHLASVNFLDIRHSIREILSIHFSFYAISNFFSHEGDPLQRGVGLCDTPRIVKQ